MGKIAASLVATTTIVCGASFLYWYLHCCKKKPVFVLEDTELEASLPSDQGSDEANKVQDANACSLDAAEAARLEGNRLYRLEKYGEAIESYSNSIALYPTNHPDLALGYSNRAACLLVLGKLQEVADDCSKALDINPLFIKALCRRSKALFELGNTEESLIGLDWSLFIALDATVCCILENFQNKNMIDQVDRILKIHSERAAEIDLKSRKYIAPSKWAVRDFLLSFPETRNRIQSPASANSDPVYREIAQAFLAEDYGVLEEIMHKANADASYNNDAYLLDLQGSLNFLKGNLKDASECFDRALSLDCENFKAELLVKRGLVFYETGQFDDAAKYIDSACTLEANNISANFYRAEELANAGNVDSALKYYDKCIRIDYEFALAYIHKARLVLASCMDYSKAESIISKGLSHSPNSSELLNVHAEILVVQKDYEKAEKVLQRAAKIDCTPQVLLNIGLLNIAKSGSPEDGIDSIKEAINLDPTYVPAYLQLANISIGRGNVQEANTSFLGAIKTARTMQELISIHSLKTAAIVHLKIASKYPQLADKLKYKVMAS